jgi:hypothetical protein
MAIQIDSDTGTIYLSVALLIAFLRIGAPSYGEPIRIQCEPFCRLVSSRLIVIVDSILENHQFSTESI